MEGNRFDAIARIFARRRLSRREALRKGSAGLVASAVASAGLSKAVSAQNATPGVDFGKKTQFLFLQSVQSGTIAPKEGADDKFTLTLEHGLGQTIYFSDRPERIVGATPTGKFLEGLGFPEDNPPNAALVLQNNSGATDITVLELYKPVFDAERPGVTYEVSALANWEQSVDLDFSQEPADLSTLPAHFGNAHLFIDDCPDGSIGCCPTGSEVCGEKGCICGPGFAAVFTVGFCYSWSGVCCRPCWDYSTICNQVSACRDGCNATIWSDSFSTCPY